MKKLLFILLIVGVLIMLRPINEIIKNNVGNIIHRLSVVTGEVAVDNSDGSYGVFIAGDPKIYPKIFTLARDPDIAIGDTVRILYKNGDKNNPIIWPPEKPTAKIDIGSKETIWDTGFYYKYGYTRILKENPANASGKITSVEMWAKENLSGTVVAIFTEISPNIFTARNNAFIGNVIAGSKQTFIVDLNVVTGDYIGIYFSSGYLGLTMSGDGYWTLDGNQTSCNGLTFELIENRTISLYGSN